MFDVRRTKSLFATIGILVQAKNNSPFYKPNNINVLNLRLNPIWFGCMQVFATGLTMKSLLRGVRLNPYWCNNVVPTVKLKF